MAECQIGENTITYIRKNTNLVHEWAMGRCNINGKPANNDRVKTAIIKFVKCRTSLIFDAVQYRAMARRADHNGRGDCHHRVWRRSHTIAQIPPTVFYIKHYFFSNNFLVFIFSLSNKWITKAFTCPKPIKSFHWLEIEGGYKHRLMDVSWKVW